MRRSPFVAREVAQHLQLKHTVGRLQLAAFHGTAVEQLDLHALHVTRVLTCIVQ